MSSTVPDSLRYAWRLSPGFVAAAIGARPYSLLPCLRKACQDTKRGERNRSSAQARETHSDAPEGNHERQKDQGQGDRQQPATWGTTSIGGVLIRGNRTVTIV